MDYSSILTWYNNVIEELDKILNIVPYNENNKNVVIPKLSSLIIETGCLLDTVFFELSTSDKDTPNITDYRKQYEAELGLSMIKILFYSDEPVVLQPFMQWGNAVDNNLSWWQHYNKLKHERLTSMKVSTLETAINIIAGLSVFISRSVSFFDILNRNDLIITNSNPDYIKKEYNSIWITRHHEVSFENKLFLIPFGMDSFPENINDVNTWIYMSKKIKRYFSRWG